MKRTTTPNNDHDGAWGVVYNDLVVVGSYVADGDETMRQVDKFYNNAFKSITPRKGQLLLMRQMKDG